MSVWFRDGDPSLMESAVQIAWNFLERAGEIDDPEETIEFLANKSNSCLIRASATNWCCRTAPLPLFNTTSRPVRSNMGWSRDRLTIR